MTRGWALVQTRDPVFTIEDAQGQRMVLPRRTSGEAIDVIVEAFAGELATPEQRRACWAELRDGQGYRVVQS